MLADVELFAKVESILKEKGVIESFEKENGEIIGRMMIVNGEIPQDLQSQIQLTDGDTVFIGRSVQPLKTSFISVILVVSKLLRSRDVRLEQPENILYIGDITSIKSV